MPSVSMRVSLCGKAQPARLKDDEMVIHGADAVPMCPEQTAPPHSPSGAVTLSARSWFVNSAGPGTCLAEVRVLSPWIEALDSYETLKELPLVFDRGLTSEANLVELVDKKRRFVTCARESQVESWNLGIDLVALADLPAVRYQVRHSVTLVPSPARGGRVRRRDERRVKRTTRRFGGATRLGPPIGSPRPHSCPWPPRGP